MRIRENQVRILVKQALEEALTFKRLPAPGGKGTIFDRDLMKLRQTIDSVVRSNASLPDDHPSKSSEAEIRDYFQAAVDQIRRGSGDETGLGVEKRMFDKGSEVARGGYKVRVVTESIQHALLYWSKDDEVSCQIFRALPLAPVDSVALLLGGGVVTFADPGDVQSFSTWTPSGRRRYPDYDTTGRVNPEEKIRTDWADVDEFERVWATRVGREFRENAPAREAFVKGSFPEAVIVSGPEKLNEAQVDEIIEDLAGVDLPIVDVRLRPLTLERARKILETGDEP